MSEAQSPNQADALDRESTPDLHRWKLPPGRHGLSRELVEQSQRERLLAAAMRVTALKGYEACTVADILDKAGVGRETFYQHFKNKESCFAAANDILLSDFESKVSDAYSQPGSWPERVRLGLAAMLDWFAEHQLVARVMLVEMGKLGTDAGSRFEQTYRRFTTLLEADPDLTERAPDFPHLATLAGGAVFARVYEKVLVGDCANLPQLLPELTFELLLPYVGEEDAVVEREIAREEMAKEAVYP